MKLASRILSLAISIFFFSADARAQGAIAGIDTNGTTFLVDQKNGTLTQRTQEPFTNFSLGGSARAGNKLYYVVAPAGTTENALYTVNVKANTITHVDLDRSESVRALFFSGKRMFGIFYDGNAGTAGVYRIAPKTGITTLVLDLSALDVEPIAGAIASLGDFFYILVKPEIDGTQRRLLRFKTRANSAVLANVADGAGSPVLCDKLKPNAAKQNFVCLAQAGGETQVNVCRLTLKGKATCLNTLTGILRIGSGHTMLTADEKTYYAFGYAPGEPNNQRLVKFSASGKVKSNLPVSTIFIGAHFPADVPAID